MARKGEKGVDGSLCVARREGNDVVRAEADDAERVVPTRIEELVDRYSGCLDTGGSLREQIEGLRQEGR
jgi:hypothetical protein